MQPVCALAVQPVWSLIADRIGRRKQILVLLSVAASALSIIYYVGTSFAGSLVVTFLFSAFFQALLPLCDSLVIEAAERSGCPFSRIRMGGTIGYAAVVAVVGYALEAVPALQFVIVSAALLVFAAQTARLPQPWRESDQKRSIRVAAERRGAKGDSGERGSGLLSIFDTTEIVYVLAFAFVDFLGLGFLGAFLGSWCIEIGYGQELVGTLSAISAASEIPILFVSAALISRFGELRLLGFSCIAMSLRLLFVGTGIVPVMMIGQLLQSFSYMTVYFSCVTYISRHTYSTTRARGQSVLAMIQSGLAMVIASLFGGWLCDALGTAAAFRVFSALMICGLVIVLVARACLRGKTTSRL